MNAPLLFLSLIALAFSLWFNLIRQPHDVSVLFRLHSPKVLVSYGYMEVDNVQRENFQFFIKAGIQPHSYATGSLDFVIVSSTDKCTPCRSLIQEHENLYSLGPDSIGIRRVASKGNLTIIFRTENQGMDLGSHNVSLSYLHLLKRITRYSFFLFINSSVKGPFIPSWVPRGWDWTQAFVSRFIKDIHIVACSIVCLPEQDDGGPGPRVESWAFAVDSIGLDAIREVGAMSRDRTCKLCEGKDGIVVGGEYRLGMIMLRRGYNMATLLSKYGTDVDWRDPTNWRCNNNVHPSRPGTYEGISMHPYETLFVKRTWHVSDAYTDRYSAWKIQHLNGSPGTVGSFDQEGYEWAISHDAVQLETKKSDCGE